MAPPLRRLGNQARPTSGLTCRHGAMEFFTAILFLFCLAAVLVTLALIVMLMSSQPPNLHRSESEKSFIDPKIKDEKKQKIPFPHITDEPSVDLSVIVPAYYEEKRLPVMMEETVGYLEARQKTQSGFTYEVIIVDDGSKDNTSKVALGYTYKYGSDKVRVLRLWKNRGKGGAIRMGMLSARGRLLLFADADGATQFSDVDKLEQCMTRIVDRETNLGVVCGSRAHLEKESIATRSLFRTMLMRAFHFLVWSLCVKTVRDTQCGFKLVTRPTAHLLFYNLHVDRWAFDTDMLFIAEFFNIPIGEVSVKWTEIEGSKLTPIFSWLEMGRDLLMIRLRYMTGGWELKPLDKLQ